MPEAEPSASESPAHTPSARLLAWLIAGLLCASSAGAEPAIPRSELPGLGQGHQRDPVDAEAMPWRSLGRVQTELGSRCTGTLIAPDQVLTAAHCLVAPRTGQMVQAGSVHFLLGYAAGHYKAHRRAVSFHLGPGYRAAEKGPATADWAILRLDAPLDTAALPLRPPRRGDAVLLGGYQQDRPELLMADTACRIGDLGGGNGPPLLLHDCAGTRGASGAPLLRREGPDSWSIVGIAVAAARRNAGGIAISSQAITP
jgi:protease YdgD